MKATPLAVTSVTPYPENGKLKQLAFSFEKELRDIGLSTIL